MWEILFHITALLTAPPPHKFCHQQHPAILRHLIFSPLSLASFIPFLFILPPSSHSLGLLHTNTEAVMKAVYFLFSSNPVPFFSELSKLLLFWICFLFALCLLIIMLLSLLTCSFRATFSCATRACLSVCTSTLGAAYSVDLSAFYMMCTQKHVYNTRIFLRSAFYRDIHRHLFHYKTLS